jgi:hypothetical protein
LWRHDDVNIWTNGANDSTRRETRGKK